MLFLKKSVTNRCKFSLYIQKLQIDSKGSLRESILLNKEVGDINNMSYQEKVPNAREHALASLSGTFPAKIHRYTAWLSIAVTSLLLFIAGLGQGVANAQV